MSAPDHAMVLAAGFGSRMGDLTRATPKPLLRAGGATLLDHSLDICAGARVRRAVVNLHYLGDQIRSYLSDRASPEIIFSDEQPRILDTGGGIVQALPDLGAGPFFTLNSDNIFVGPNPLGALARDWAPARMDALMLLVPKSRARSYARYGDFSLPEEGAAPQRRGERATAPLVYTGAQIISPLAFRDAPTGAFSTNLIWDRLLAEGRLAAITYDGIWVDVGTPEGLAEADRMLGSSA